MEREQLVDLKLTELLKLCRDRNIDVTVLEEQIRGNLSPEQFQTLTYRDYLDLRRYVKQIIDRNPRIVELEALGFDVIINEQYRKNSTNP